MTDNLQTGNLSEPSSGSVGTTNVSTSTSQSVSSEPRLVPQHEVDKVVGAVKHRAYEDGYKAAQTAWEQQREQLNQSHQGVSHQAPQSSVPDVKKLVQEELATILQQQEAYSIQQRTVTELQRKIEEAKTRYTDFDTTVGQSLKEGYFSDQILLAANTVENSGDVLKELHDNPAKYGAIQALPWAAQQRAMRQLSDSIKQNQMAQQTAPQIPASPLSSHRPTALGGVNKGKEGWGAIKQKIATGRY